MSRRKRTGGPAFSLFAFQDIITCVMGIMLLLTLIMSLQIASSPGAQTSSRIRDQAQMLQAESKRLLIEIDAMESRLVEQMSAINSGAILDPTLLSQARDRASREANAAQQEAARISQIVNSSQESLDSIRVRFGEIDQIGAETVALEQLRKKLRQDLQELRSGRKRVYNAHESTSKSCWIIEITSLEDIRVARMGNEENTTRLAGISALIDWVETKQSEDVAFMLLVKPDAANALEQISKSLVKGKRPFGFDLLPQDTTVLQPTEVP